MSVFVFSPTEMRSVHKTLLLAMGEADASSVEARKVVADVLVAQWAASNRRAYEARSGEPAPEYSCDDGATRCAWRPGDCLDAIDYNMAEDPVLQETPPWWYTLLLMYRDAFTGSDAQRKLRTSALGGLVSGA